MSEKKNLLILAANLINQFCKHFETMLRFTVEWIRSLLYQANGMVTFLHCFICRFGVSWIQLSIDRWKMNIYCHLNEQLLIIVKTLYWTKSIRLGLFYIIWFWPIQIILFHLKEIKESTIDPVLTCSLYSVTDK